ncbi:MULTISPECIES: acyl-CoA thioesterase [Amycolatopsis]|uniref:Thioesterase family protein n=1 Tax=Amycolatopsis tucumanensis TaxID=401106 RepID=A0ABP7JFB5_9PSEU|nr:thioesterase family protein [Amycolatopsis tucumanensis]MCF6427287.1 thioesterase family protein [Amycolatopsis tucumanensis]
MSRFRYHCAMRWSDLDSLGHVADTSYLRYLGECRLELIHRLLPRYEAQDLARGSVVTRQSMTYLRPLCYRTEPITVETWVTDIKAAVVRFAYLVRDDAYGYLEGEADLVPVDLRYGTPRRLTENERTHFGAYREATSLSLAASTHNGG